MLGQVWDKINNTLELDRDDLISLLAIEHDDERALLFSLANKIRQQEVGDEIHLRGLIEFSNYCRKNCTYCGLRRHNKQLERYRMEPEEILTSVQQAARLGYRTVVLQSGEDPYYTLDRLCGLLRAIKKHSDTAITLSIGERPREEYQELYDAGADRFLLRFETSNPEIYARLHPDSHYENRMQILRWFREIGYEVGSGIMIGLPGQTLANLADDILAFKTLDLDMIGVGPFIAHPQTPLAHTANGTVEMSLKVIALTRIVTRDTNIPATTALATLRPEDGRELALQAGANVLMPNVTPVEYRSLYELYPDKVCVGENAEQCRGCTQRRVYSLNRMPADHSGASPHWQNYQTAKTGIVIK